MSYVKNNLQLKLPFLHVNFRVLCFNSDTIEMIFLRFKPFKDYIHITVDIREEMIEIDVLEMILRKFWSTGCVAERFP